MTIKKYRNKKTGEIVRAVLYTGDIKPLYALAKRLFFRNSLGDWAVQPVNEIAYKMRVGYVYYVRSGIYGIFEKNKGYFACCFEEI